MSDPPSRAAAGGAPGPVRRRRDRRGRGVRGTRVPWSTGSESLDRRFGLPTAVPAARTRAERFDDYVLAAVEELEERWAEQLERVEFAVEEVPPAEKEGGGFDVLGGGDEVALSRLHPAAGAGAAATPPRIVLYRRPVEARSGEGGDRADLVLDVVVHEVAHLLGLTPQDIDPEGHGPWDDED